MMGVDAFEAIHKNAFIVRHACGFPWQCEAASWQGSREILALFFQQRWFQVGLKNTYKEGKHLLGVPPNLTQNSWPRQRICIGPLFHDARRSSLCLFSPGLAGQAVGPGGPPSSLTCQGRPVQTSQPIIQVLGRRGKRTPCLGPMNKGLSYFCAQPPPLSSAPEKK